MITELFPEYTTEKGAMFSKDRVYRFALWRIWDKNKPIVMFIGLNPSTANEDENDPTIKRVASISKHNGYGGFYMMNCFPFISTDPRMLVSSGGTIYNNIKMIEVAKKCDDIVFAWGNFEIVRTMGVDYILSRRFPNAKALHINKNGSPKHPLYCKADSVFIPFK